MAAISITLAAGDYDRTVALRTGDVAAEGCELNYLVLPPGELFYRLFTHREFDAAEMSLSTYMLARAKGDWPYIALPVFLSRAFPHASIYVSAGSRIMTPEDLRGKTVGVPNYHLTRGLSARGVLADDYGVHAEDLRWRVGGVDRPEDFDYVGVEVPGVDIAPIKRGTHLARLLAAGEIDAIISYRDPQMLTDGDPAIRRLFPDPAGVARDYYTRTGVFPIMHVLGVRSELIERHRWLARSLTKAFEAAKDMWLARYTDLDAPAVALPFLAEHARDTAALMGDDFWPYGVGRNRQTLETQARWSHEQGLTPEPVAPEDLFAPQTLSWYRPE